LSIVLFCLAPLPNMVEAVGWNHLAGVLVALVGATALAAAFGWLFFIGFLIAVGLPAWWLGYLALLARPLQTTGDVEWYPIGRLVLWGAVLGTIIVACAILSFGFDA